LYFIAGGFVGSLPWLGFYLLKLDRTKFFYYLIGSAVEHSRRVFVAYPEMERSTAYLLACIIVCWLATRLTRGRAFGKYAWMMVLLVVSAYLWTFREYAHLANLNSLVGAIDNVMSFLGPAACIAASAVVLVDSRSEPEAHTILEEDAGIAMLIPLQAFFFLVAYPHTKYTHLSWSNAGALMLLLFLLERGRKRFAAGWPEQTRKTIGRAIGAAVFLALPVLILLSKIFWLVGPFISVSPDLRKWSKKDFVMLNNERAGIYEAISSAVQIESVDRFIRTHTEEGEYVFEFPTTFFYYYSRRKNPSKWDYFYPGLYSDKQGEIISDLERAKPRFAVIFDNPEGWLFTYANSEIQEEFGELIAYIHMHYDMERQIGHFRILERKIGG
jgi:hypothetical protein